MINNLSAGSLFRYYIFHPRSNDLNAKDKRIATAVSFLLGVFTVGMMHLFCRTFLYKDLSGKPAATADKIDQVFTARVTLSGNPYPNDPLFHFFLGDGKDNQRRGLEEILQWDNARKEKVHDYIQWLFPTYQRSQFNRDAPELTPELVSAMKQNPQVKQNMRRAFELMLHFYGLHYDASAQTVIPADDFESRVHSWCTPGNHNMLRITRILNSLKIFGFDAEARAFLEALAEVKKQYGVPDRSYQFWVAAATK